MATKLIDIPNQIAVEGVAFSFQIPNGTFSTSGTVQYRFEIQRRVRNCTLRRCLDDSENWMYAAGDILYGTPTAYEHFQSLNIEVTCLDINGPAYAIFNLTVVNNDYVGTRKPMVRYNQVFDHTITSANIAGYNWGSISSGQYVKIAASVGDPSAGNTTNIDTARTNGAIICWEVDNTNRASLDWGKVKSFDTVGLTHGLYRWEPGKTGNSLVGASGAPIYITNLGSIATVDNGIIAGAGVQNAAAIGLQGLCSYYIMCGQGTHADPYGLKVTTTVQPCFQILNSVEGKRYEQEIAYVEIPGTNGIGFHFKSDVTYTSHSFNSITDNGSGKIKITINGVNKTSNFPAKTDQQSIVFHTTAAGYDQRGKIMTSTFTGVNTELVLDEAFVAIGGAGTIYEIVNERPNSDWEGLKIHDNYLYDCREEGVSSGGEAMYIGKGFGDGYDLVLPGSRLVYPHDLRKVHCTWNIIERCGWDLWQARNVVDPTSKFKYNYVIDSGWGGWSSFEEAVDKQITDPTNNLNTALAQTQGMDWGTYSIGEFAYNYIENVMNVGIFYNFSGESYMHHNIVYNCQDEAIYSADGGKTYSTYKGWVSNNTERIAGNLQKGYVYNNLLIRAGDGFESFAKLPTIQIVNNLFVNCNTNGFNGNIRTNPDGNFSHNNNLFLENANLASLFKNEVLRDFRPITGSAADGAGVLYSTNVVQDKDFGGQKCTGRSSYAIGAFEVDSFYNYNLYHVAKNMIDGTIIRWYKADDNLGTNEYEIGHGELVFTPPSTGYYRMSVQPKAKTGVVTGFEVFTSWVNVV
jgi:hypothetical protein